MDDDTKERIAQTTKGFDFVLHDMCMNKDWGEVRSCVKVFANTAKVPSQSTAGAGAGDLPIHLALFYSCPQDVAEALIHAYPECVTIPNSKNQYPLQLALGAENASAIYNAEFLIALITPETAQGINTYGETAVMAAVSKDFSVAVITSLIEAYPGALQIPDEMDNLPLHEAIEQGRNANIIQLVYDAYPAATTIENGMGEIVEGFWTTQG